MRLPVVLGPYGRLAQTGQRDDSFAPLAASPGQMPSWRAARSFMISSDPPPMTITLTSR